jgi:hypothetical protein
VCGAEGAELHQRSGRRQAKQHGDEKQNWMSAGSHRIEDRREVKDVR